MQSRNGQLVTAWLMSLAVAAAMAAGASTFALRQKLEFGFHGSIVIFFGLIVCYFGPRLYWEFIRRKRAAGDPAATHQVLFALYLFPAIPLVLFGLAILLVNSGVFD